MNFQEWEASVIFVDGCIVYGWYRYNRGVYMIKVTSKKWKSSLRVWLLGYRTFMS